MVDAERFQRAADLFLRARALGLSEREQFLASECGDDADLRASVSALIAGAERSLPFAELAAELGGALAPLVAEAPPTVDNRLGNYRLLEKLGEGGFGTVYMAEQVEPMRRKVALKILRPGLDTKQIIARFEAERQALALMDHPNITRVLDAGTTPHGLPYFVMELIRGLPITHFCDQHLLDTRARIQLMLPVCHAVQHAHQKGIIHRDLKPSNVLVTLQDGVPVPKIIDFGIAKALHVPLTDRTLFTGFRQIMGTPEYMSPEQAETSALDIDTRTDVFSLGVMLYELLTGTTPLDAKTLREASYGEMQRLIREVEPPTPSRRLVTLDQPDGRVAELPTTRAREVAQARASDPRALRRLLTGELDWIVMKCLEKERRRRYDTAAALAADLASFLAHEPVLAGPPSQLYRLRKLAQRHRALFAGALVLFLAVCVALTGVTWGLLSALDQRDRARAAHEAAMENTREIQALSDVLRDMLRVAAPRGMRDEHYSVRQMLTDFEGDLGARLADQPEQEVLMRMVLGEVLEMAESRAESVHQLERAVERARRSLEPNSPILASALEYLAYVRNQTDLPAEALRLAEEALAVRRGNGESAGSALVQVMRAHSALGAHRLAIALGEEALAAVRKESGESSAEYANTLSVLGGVLLVAGQAERAEPMLAEAIERRRATLGAGHSGVANVVAQCVLARVALGRDEGAEAELEAAAAAIAPEAAFREMAGASLAVARAAWLEARGRFDEARDGLHACLALKSEGSAIPSRLLNVWLELLELSVQTGKLDEAGELLAKLPIPSAPAGATPCSLRRRQLAGLWHHRRAELTPAAEELEAALAGVREHADGDSPWVASISEQLAAVSLDRGQRERAVELARSAVRARESAPYPAWRLTYARALLAAASSDRARYDASWSELRAVAGLPPEQRAWLAALAGRPELWRSAGR